MGANIFRDIFASITDIVGGRSAVYEKELNTAKDLAMQEMSWEAEALGANAIIAVDLDYETISMGKGGGMLMVSASGTDASMMPRSTSVRAQMSRTVGWLAIF